MSFPFCYLLLVFLCVSPHACNSRLLGLLNKESKNDVRLSGKDYLKQGEVAEKTVIGLKHRRRFIFEKLHPEEVQIAKSAEGFDNEITMKKNDVNLEEGNMNIKGIDHKLSSSVEVVQETTEIKGLKLQARSTMESKNQDDTDENIKSEETGFVEDVVVMDYAQPHRKPPIHNLEP